MTAPCTCNRCPACGGFLPVPVYPYPNTVPVWPIWPVYPWPGTVPTYPLYPGPNPVWGTYTTTSPMPTTGSTAGVSSTVPFEVVGVKP